MIKSAWEKSQPVLWAVMILLIPITSLPLLVRYTGAGSVASPSGLILLIFLVFWLIPYLVKGGKLPPQVRPLFVFIIITILSACISIGLDIPSSKNISPFSSQLKAFFTLAIGVSFYLVASVWTQKPERSLLTLKWLNYAGLLLILWGFAQAFAWYGYHRYPQWMRDFHDLYSMGPLYRQRVTGFALEPSWLAHQLNTLFLPVWLAASVQRYSSHRSHLWGISFENVLLFGGSVILLLTLSRVGMLAFALMVGYLLIRANVRFMHFVQMWISSRWQQKGIVQTRFQMLLMTMLPILLVLGYLLLLAGGALALSRIDPRMAKLLDFHAGSDNPLLRYANELNFAARMVYWQAGWSVYQNFPWMGVGLGNGGFFLPAHLTGYAWGLFEVRDLLFRSSALLNIKSVWVRLLAETGIVGFSVFISWLVVIWFSARVVEKVKEPLMRVIGLAGKLIIIGYLLEGFSVDTFAFPYPWLFFGLVTAAVTWVYRRNTLLEV